MPQFSMGCDPELFLWDNVLQRIVPAVGKIGGTKEKPLRLTDGTVQLDGTVVEIGTDPAYTAEEFVQKLSSVIREVQAKLDGRFKGRYSLRCGASAAYNPEDTFDPVHLDVGCSPDFEFNSEGQLIARATRESQSIDCIPTGGHIHVGFGCNLPITDIGLLTGCARYANHLESDDFHDEAGCTFDEDRDAEMGLWGLAVRIKPYGMELRSPSAYWLADQELAKALFNYLEAVFNYMVGGVKPKSPRSFLYKGYCAVDSQAHSLPAKYQATLPLDF